MKIALATSILCVSALLAGCSQTPSDAEADGASAEGTPKVREFKGKVDPTLAGTWKPEQGAVILTLNSDGSSVSDGIVPMNKGTMHVHTLGKWLIDGEDLLMKSGKDFDHLSDPIIYKWKVDGEKLTVKLGSYGPTTVYHRQSGSK